MERCPCNMKESLNYININVEVVKIFKTAIKIIGFSILTIYRKIEYFIRVLTQRF